MDLKTLNAMTTIKGSVCVCVCVCVINVEVVLIQAPICLASQNKGTCFIWAGSKSRSMAY